MARKHRGHPEKILIRSRRSLDFSDILSILGSRRAASADFIAVHDRKTGVYTVLKDRMGRPRTISGRDLPLDVVRVDDGV